MSESFIQLNAGSGGLKAHTNKRTVGANDVEDEYTLPGEYALASYFCTANGVSAATSGTDIFQIMAGSSNPVRVRRITIKQQAAASAVGATVIQLVRLTTAGTGGTSITPRALDSADAAAGFTAMHSVVTPGTSGNILYDRSLWAGTAAIPVIDVWEWKQLENTKPIIIPAGTTNGIIANLVTGLASLTLTITAEVVETTFV